GPLGAGTWNWTGRPWARLAWLLAAGLQVAALIRCQSLGSWLALAVGLGACTAVRLLQRGRRRLVGLAGLVALAAALGIGVHPPLTVRNHVQGRLHLCRTALEVAVRAFPLGAGAGQFHGAFLEAQADVLSRRPQDQRFWSNAYHAHNEV